MKKTSTLIVSLFYSALLCCQNEISLQQARELVEKNSNSLNNKTLEINAAVEAKKGAFTSFFPKVSLTAFAFHSKDELFNLDNPGGNLPVYDGNPVNIPLAQQFAYLPPSSNSFLKKGALGMINVVQPLYTGGKIKAGNKLASLNIEVKEQEQIIAKNEILLKMEDQYWQIISLQERLRTIEKFEEFTSDLYKQIKDSYKSGLVIKNDLLKVQLKQNETYLTKKNLLNGKKLALMHFCQLIGITYDSTLILLKHIQKHEEPREFFVSIESVLPKRPESILLKKSVNAEQLQTKINRADHLPKVMAGATGYYFNGLDHNEALNTLGYFSISIPISNFWKGLYTLRERELREKIANNTSVETMQLLSLQIEKAWMDLESSFDYIQLAEMIKEQSSENLRISKDQYSSGVSTVSDVLAAHALYMEAETKFLEAQSNYQIAIRRYKQYTGRFD